MSGLNPDLFHSVGLGLFGVAIVHTFFTKFFENLGHIELEHYHFQSRSVANDFLSEAGKLDLFLARHEALARFIFRHRGALRLIGEPEMVFPFWAINLCIYMFLALGQEQMVHYVETLNLSEPMFVAVIMMISASRPVRQFAENGMKCLAWHCPGSNKITLLFVLLFVGPLLGSLITEPAAMTITALLLGKFYYQQISHRKRYRRMRYSILAVLLVNVSIGGVLTHYAAPPVVMVANTWNWDMSFMFFNFGWKAVLAVLINTVLVIGFNWKQLQQLDEPSDEAFVAKVPGLVVGFHLVLLGGVVYFSHHPKVFLMIFAIYFFNALAYEQYQDEKLFFRQSIMVGLFLAGLVTIGSCQKWWLQPLITGLDSVSLFAGTVGLTAITDNAALTYLGSIVDGLTDQSKYMLVAGAVTGGGLTIIANAPNPVGINILKDYFGSDAVSFKSLFLYATAPTAIAALAFLVL
ncbi:MAG: putative Na+/H+ antiporter [Candidatus Buchananbacteria bacterium]|nr:putative Na+/H+ antiporter [Candidatus Buchananbacteria bacterium]